MKKKIQSAKKIKDHFQKFLREENSASIILIILSIVSLLLSNAFPFSEQYINTWRYSFSGLNSFHLPESSLLIINDLLMPLFFFTVGAEIKHELVEGSLNTIKKASLPLVAAIGGMILPAIVYSLFNKGTDYKIGWAIPTATDIAFSLAVLSMLGKSIPREIKIFLMALAIFDDLGAITIIALFYGEKIQIGYFLLTAIVSFVLYLSLQRKIKLPIFCNYLLYILLWYCLHLSGLHATLSGVIVAMLMPLETLRKTEHSISKIVNFGILPLFVLSNTAIAIHFNIADFPMRVFLGIFFGLVIGKPLGIFLITRIGVKNLKIVALSKSLTMFDVIGVGFLAGIGFTMSIFVANLSFPNHLSTLETAKLSVIIASFLSAVFGYVWFNTLKKIDWVQEFFSLKKVKSK
ncbi:MAG: Na+/H+ antiporter NhaA [Chitinophagaceae bacterium]